MTPFEQFLALNMSPGEELVEASFPVPAEGLLVIEFITAGLTVGIGQSTSNRADSGSCSAPNRRGEAGHPAQDPRCAPGHYRYGAVRAAHRGPRSGGGR
jgi:hypothetical protein